LISRRNELSWSTVSTDTKPFSDSWTLCDTLVVVAMLVDQSSDRNESAAEVAVACGASERGSCERERGE